MFTYYPPFSCKVAFNFVAQLVLLSYFFSAFQALALPPPTDLKGRFGQPPPIVEETVPEHPTQTPPSLLPPVPDREAPTKKRPVFRVFVREIKVIGSTIFPQEELDEITDPFVGKEITTEELEEVRRGLTILYKNQGYVNSGAIVPDQTVADGIITIQIIEGQLQDIEIEGTKQFYSFYLRDRLFLSAGPPLNINPLQERLQLLLQDSRFDRINAELKAGLRPGQSILHLRVQEANPYRAWIEINNFQSPTVGAERGLATVAHQNPLGIGDSFRLTYGQSKGVGPLIDFSYSIPLLPHDTLLILQFRKNSFEVIEAPFDALQIESESDIYTITLRHPVFRTPNQEFALAITGEYLQNRGTLLGIPFSFTPGSTANGVTTIGVIRLAQEWTHRQPNQVFSVRSRMSFGIDVLQATNNNLPNTPDTQFFSWIGQVQGARRFPSFINTQIIGRMDLQLSDDPLFPLEQYALGGRFTVRGYRENQIVRDNAFLFTVESRIPVYQSPLEDHLVEFASFLDVGKGWNTDRDSPTDFHTLASIGLGLRGFFFKRFQYQIYWGIPLNHRPTPGGNLQDHGVHVGVVVNLF